MRKQSYILSTILAFFLVLILVMNYLGPKQTSMTHIENFTPGIRKMARPHLRNARIATQEYREYFTDKTNQSLKMLGLQII